MHYTAALFSYRGLQGLLNSLIIASAFPAIVVYAQDLLPGRTGTVAGLFFGLAFGMGSVGAAISLTSASDRCAPGSFLCAVAAR